MSVGHIRAIVHRDPKCPKIVGDPGDYCDLSGRIHIGGKWYSFSLIHCNTNEDKAVNRNFRVFNGHEVIYQYIEQNPSDVIPFFIERIINQLHRISIRKERR